MRRHGFTPRARIHALTVTGSDPVFMLTGPIPATEQVLARGHLEVDDIGSGVGVCINDCLA